MIQQPPEIDRPHPPRPPQWVRPVMIALASGMIAAVFAGIWAPSHNLSWWATAGVLALILAWVGGTYGTPPRQTPYDPDTNDQRSR